MDNFKAVYKILKALEASMDLEAAKGVKDITPGI